MCLRYYHRNQANLGDSTRNICHALASGTVTRAFIEILENFLQDRPVRSASNMNESVFQAIIEAIFVETGPCLPELCLVVEPTKERGDGQYGFIDLFLAVRIPPPCSRAQECLFEGTLECNTIHSVPY